MITPCHWGILLVSFGGAILGWVIITGGMLLVERYVPPRRRE